MPRRPDGESGGLDPRGETPPWLAPGDRGSPAVIVRLSGSVMRLSGSEMRLSGSVRLFESNTPRRPDGESGGLDPLGETPPWLAPGDRGSPAGLELGLGV